MAASEALQLAAEKARESLSRLLLDDDVQTAEAMLREPLALRTPPPGVAVACLLSNLGLCALHLWTGGVPYEEVLAEALCPPALCAAVAAAWERESEGFAALFDVLEESLTPKAPMLLRWLREPHKQARRLSTSSLRRCASVGRAQDRRTPANGEGRD